MDSFWGFFGYTTAPEPANNQQRQEEKEDHVTCSIDEFLNSPSPYWVTSPKSEDEDFFKGNWDNHSKLIQDKVTGAYFRNPNNYFPKLLIMLYWMMRFRRSDFYLYITQRRFVPMGDDAKSLFFINKTWDPIEKLLGFCRIDHPDVRRFLIDFITLQLNADIDNLKKRHFHGLSRLAKASFLSEKNRLNKELKLNSQIVQSLEKYMHFIPAGLEPLEYFRKCVLKPLRVYHNHLEQELLAEILLPSSLLE